MQTISSAEFAAHQDKYFDLALNDDICIQKGQKRFLLTYEPIVAEQPILAPDDNLHRAITIDELRESVHEHIHNLYAKK